MADYTAALGGEVPLRVSPFDQSLPAPRASLDVRAARVLPGDQSRRDTFYSGGRPERIVGPTFGIARQLALYRENEAPYAAPALSRFHVLV